MSRTTSESSGDKAAKSDSASKASKSASTSASSVEKREASKAADTKRAERGPGFFGTIGLFLRQVMAELRKVVTPSRSELIRYTGVVLVFVVLMMLLVTALDLLFGIGASWVFGTGTEVTWPDFSTMFGGTPAPTEPAVPTP